MASFQEQILQINKLRTAYEKADNAYYSKKLEVQKRLKPAHNAEVIEELKANEVFFMRNRNVLNAAISQLHLQNPRVLTKELQGNIPILLLPVRIETRFVNPPNAPAAELWLRIFPDDIHANSHEKVLTEKEIEAGQTYWSDLLKATNKESKIEAWATFKINVTGAQRAIWVAKKTKPTNWPTTAIASANFELVFPIQSNSKTHTWTQAPLTQALPDRFVVSIFKNDLLVFEQTGAVIPDTVFLGPDPFLGEEVFKKEGDEIKFHEDIEWLQNFDKAVSIGLGIKIRLNANLFNAQGLIERISVMGILHSADAAKGTSLIENLIENHHFSAKGLSVLPQGTATNNTEKDNSGYSKNEDNLLNGFYEGAPVAIDAENDISLISKYLGINFQTLSEVNNADLAEQKMSLAFNKALYAGTLSYFFNELMNPAVKPADAIQIRHFFTNYVSARGALPAIRVGDQPYGILVSSDITRWTEGQGKNFFNGLSEVLRRLQKVWDSLAKKHSLKVGMPGNTSEILLKILGLQSGSVAFRQRLGNLPDFSYSMPNINIENFNVEIKALNQRIVDFLTTLGFNSQADGNFYPLISNLIFYNWTNEISAKKLVSNEKPSAENAFLPKLPKSGLNYIQWIAQKSTVAGLEAVSFDGDIPPRTLLCLLLRHAMLTELKHSSIKYLNTNGVAVNSASFEKSLFNFNKEAADLSTYELLRADARKINDVKFREASTGIGDFLLKARPFQVINADLSEMRKAMKLISELPIEKLEKHLAEFIDLCAYRLDAWQTGLFNRRLENNRKIAPTGLYIGAYGWIENLKSETQTAVPTNKIPELLRPENNKPVVKLRENAGFSHLPSLNHATAAGVLMAGYHNHSKSAKPDTFALNLSSQRTRKALALFEGIRNGQSLEVLLGYQFERALHDATSANPANNLNEYIAIFRNKFEIQQVSIPQQGAAEAQETIDSYPVCNGLKVQKATDLELKALVSNITHFNLIKEIRDGLSDILDACNDLLLTEASFQMTQGNRDRTAGVTNSALFADMPPEIQVVDTPRSSLLTYTHKVSLHFNTDDNLPLETGWENNITPKATMESGLNQWLSTIIGNPQKIICRVTSIDAEGAEINASFISLADLKLQPIDLVYFISEDLAGGATELEGRLAFLFRQQTNTEPDVSVKIEFKPIGIGNENKTFSQIYPLLRQLKLFITNCKVADARDFASKTKTIDSNSAPAIDFIEFRGRIEVALAQLKQSQLDFNSLVPNDVEPKDEVNPETMEAFFNLILENGDETGHINNLESSETSISAMINYQIMASSFGLQLAYPDYLNFIALPKPKENDLGKRNAAFKSILAKVFNVWKIINEKIKIAEAKLALAATEGESFQKNKLLIEAAKTILGDDFVPIPKFIFTNIEEILKTKADEDQLLKYATEKNQLNKKNLLDSWRQSIARVRPEMERFEKLCLMAEAVNNQEIGLQAIQIPFRNADSWLGFELPELYENKPFNILSDTHSIALHSSGINNLEGLQSVLIIDEWTEKIPIDNEITGIAFHYNQPNAVAPQSLILAVEPTGAAKWDWDILQGVLNDTLRRAKTRAVEPDHLMENDALRVLLPMTVASFDVNETNISLDYLLLSDAFYTKVKSSNLALYQKWNKV